MSLIQTDRPIGYLSVETNEIITERQIRELYPHVSFASPFSPPEGFTAVYPSLQPEISKAQTIKETTPVEVDGKLVQQWEVADITDTEQLAVIKLRVIEEKHTAINALRDAKLAAGFPYVFPDVAGTIQTRDLRDYTNILGNVVAGIVMNGQEVLMPFRDAEDSNHSLKPSETITMGLSALNSYTAICKVAWSHKDELKKLALGGATISDLEKYDITTGWPDNT